ncbi:MAG: hypothetical protein H0T54_10280 [Geodermatophilaceae bacterium]|nr:hypothetical protein [Geodermatophilaceae bacterium]
MSKLLGMVVVAASMALSLAPATAAAAISTYGYQGLAFGSSVATAGGILTSGETARLGFGCGTPAGLDKAASSASLNLDSLMRVGTTVSTASTTESPAASATTSSTVQTVDLLGGLVTASAIKSVASATADGTQYSVSAAGTTFTSLKVLGLPILLNVRANTRIELPGIGYVVINEQTRKVTPVSASLRVTGLHVVVTTQNLLGYEVGTNINIGQAAAALNAPSGGFLGGFAYGTQIDAAGLLTSSSTFLVTMPCAGTNNVLRDNTGAALQIPLVIDSGTIQDTIQGSTTTTTADGQSTSTIEDLNLLDGLVTATGIRSVASANRSGGVTTLSSAGSEFARITVSGERLVVADIAPNTTINLPGVGTLYLNRVIKTGNSIEVRALELVISVAQVGGLPVGADVRVAVASASAR